jgi:nucleoside-diphosphate-sugar epimerase
LKIGITGTSGFVGGCISRNLSSNNFIIKEVDRNDLYNNDLQFVLSGVDVLIHSAWVGSDRFNRDKSDVQDKNIAIAKNLMKISRNTSISRIVGIGSQDELLDGEQPWKDESKMFALTEYAKAKVESFNIFANFCLICFII